MINLTPAKGRLLISEPFMFDPNFKRTVVFLCEHSAEGSLGFVLNRPLDLKLKDVIVDVDLKDFDADLYFGGPVQNNTLHFLHRVGDKLPGSEEVIKGVYWGGDFERLKELIELRLVKPEDFRFFIGYSGWAEGQLDRELSEKSWIVAPCKPSYIFESDANLWKEALEDLGGEYKLISTFPEDPSYN